MHSLSLWPRLAWRNVWRNGRRSLLTGTIVAVCCIAILIALGFILASFEGVKYVTIHGNGLGHFQIARHEQFAGQERKPAEFGMPPATLSAVIDLVRQEPAVRKVLPRLNFQGLVSTGDDTMTFDGLGVDPDAESQAFGKSFNIVSGDYLDSDADRQFFVILGSGLAKRLHVKVGDSVTLMTAAATGQINALDVTVQGIISTGIAERDNYVLRMPLAGAQTLLRTDKVSTVAVLLKGDDLPKSLQTQLQSGLPERVKLKTWRQLDSLYDQLVTLYRGQFVVFGLILICVAFLSILNTIVMNVLERTREIGSLRAMGIDALFVRISFVFESAYICIAGALAGMLFSRLIMFAVQHMNINMPPPPGSTEGYPLQLLWDTNGAIWCVGFLVMSGIIAAWFASTRVARIDVVDAVNAH